MSDATDVTAPTRETTTSAALSVRQELCMLALLDGHTQRRAAEIGGVHEATLSRWMDDDQMFFQTFTTRKADIYRRYEARICRMVDQALGAVEVALRSEDYHAYPGPWRVSDQLHAAEMIFKMAGLLKPSSRVAVFGGGQLNMGQQQINTTGDINQ